MREEIIKLKIILKYPTILDHSKMITSRANPAWIMGYKRIYVVGGDINSREWTDKCELFDLETEKWSEFGNIYEQKAYSSLCILNQSFLYCFGGFNKNLPIDKFKDTIERIKITDIHSNQWEIVNVKLYQKMWVPSWISLNKDTMLVFGGSIGKPLNELWIFKLNKSDENKHNIIKLPAKSIKISDEFRHWNIPIPISPGKIAVIGQTWVHHIELKNLKINSIKIHL